MTSFNIQQLVEETGYRPKSDLCFQLCLTVCLSASWQDYSETTDQNFMKVYGMIRDIKQGPFDYILNELDPRSRSLEVKRSKDFMRTTLFKIFAVSRDKIKMYVAYSIL